MVGRLEEIDEASSLGDESSTKQGPNNDTWHDEDDGISSASGGGGGGGGSSHTDHKDGGDGDGGSTAHTNGDDNGTTKSGSNNTRSGAGGAEALARKEHENVLRSKFVVYVSLILAAVIVASATYYFVASDERQKYMVSFTVYSAEIIHKAESSSTQVFGLLHGLATKVMLATLASNSTWPYVTVRNFDVLSAELLQFTGADVVMLSPIVDDHDIQQWNEYSVANQGWIKEDIDNTKFTVNRTYTDEGIQPIPKTIYAYDGTSSKRINHNGNSLEAGDSFFHFHMPVWQVAPVPTNTSLINMDLNSLSSFNGVQNHLLADKNEAILSNVVDLSFLYEDVYGDATPNSDADAAALSDTVKSLLGGGQNRDGQYSIETSRTTQNLLKYQQQKLKTIPRSYLIQPVLNNFLEVNASAEITGFLIAVQPWSVYFRDILPDDVYGLIVVVENGCGSTLTFQLNGKNAVYIGPGDWHEQEYHEMSRTEWFHDKTRQAAADDSTTSPTTTNNETGAVVDDATETTTLDDDMGALNCAYTISVYSSSDYQRSFETNLPAVYSAAACTVFLLTIAVFIAYDCMVDKRQKKALAVAERTNAIVQTLFPKNIQERIMKEAAEGADKDMKKKQKWPGLFSAKQQLEEFLGDDDDEQKRLLNGHNQQESNSRPIADHFDNVTILYADIVGFTAWSSMREPAQVFTLLETLYHHFDEVAKKKGVFKVETIGDCYVAVCGLPQPRKDHALAMCRFARDCLSDLPGLLGKLEKCLGPDTTELGMRFGLHSGGVTAGVLRGERARFQLFGDSVVTASLVEHTGKKNMIQLSKQTAKLLAAAGKSHWLRQRLDKVTVYKDGIGNVTLETFWLEMSDDVGTTGTGRDSTGKPRRSRGDSKASGNDFVPRDIGVKDAEQSAAALKAKQDRLIDWVADVLASFLKQIHARRVASNITVESEKVMSEVEQARQRLGTTVLEEVVEIIKLPAFDATNSQTMSPNDVKLGQSVEYQLRNYVESVSQMYKENTFHNFEHASHVTMSVVKLLTRIVAPDINFDHLGTDEDQVASRLHDHTYGITSDPLTQFAVVFSALIHDVDHPGVPNMQLVKEGTRMAAAYKDKSVAEQNSVDISWDLLMDPSFRELRRAIYANEEEFLRFRQLVVNVVMATDIMDKDLGALRKARWEKAFSEHVDDDPTVAVHRKATIVIEHIIQASDIAHTMQHWHIYRKWNSRFFEECYKAYVDGRAEKNPIEGWYKGEIGFYDFYIIPLAKKLKNCGVFGVSSDEYLNYAQRNRDEWAQKGEEVVEQLIELVGAGSSVLHM